MTKIALAIHGGCGVMPEDSMTSEEWTAARDDLAAALRAGYGVLKAGGTALEAVEAAVVVMEDSPHFNAGHGAALNENGIHELDASIMDGATLAAGAISASRAIRNPVKAARALMADDRAVYLTGEAADRFAEEKGLATEPQSYFTTQKRREALAAMKRHAAAGTEATENEKHGTVGAVALDAAGHLAAATSTGGYTNKPDGRVGDSPVIGAGTYARDGACAVSASPISGRIWRLLLAISSIRIWRPTILARVLWLSMPKAGLQRPIIPPACSAVGLPPRVMLAWPPMTPCIRWNCRQLPLAG
jgi:L-asparaginase / beta-aspartyl-peptidase